MTRTRLSLISTTAFASLCGAIPAFAQAPAPAPMMAPAPVMAPAMAPAPMPAPEAVMPVAPVMAPKAADDMSGSVGFGVGVVAGNDLIKPDTGNLMLKYWMNDAMALVPRLFVSIDKTKGQDTSWALAPSALADFTILKGASTRFSFGIGLGLLFAKNQSATTASPADQPQPGLNTLAGGDPTATRIAIYVPTSLNVEHFFTRWFSMGVGADFNLLQFQKQGTPWTFGVELSNVRYLGSLFFYTD